MSETIKQAAIVRLVFDALCNIEKTASKETLDNKELLGYEIWKAFQPACDEWRDWYRDEDGEKIDTCTSCPFSVTLPHREAKGLVDMACSSLNHTLHEILVRAALVHEALDQATEEIVELQQEVQSLAYEIEESHTYSDSE